MNQFYYFCCKFAVVTVHAIWHFLVPFLFNPSKQGELKESILQNLRNKWPPHPPVEYDEKHYSLPLVINQITVSDIHVYGTRREIKCLS